MLSDYLGHARRTHKCTRKGWVGAGMRWVQESEKYGSAKRFGQLLSGIQHTRQEGSCEDLVIFLKSYG